MLDEKCRGALAYRELLLQLLSKELELNPDKISPNSAAIVSLASGEKNTKSDVNKDMDIIAGDVDAMLS